VITSVSTGVSKSFDILRTGGGGNNNEKETLTFRARTDSCTSKPIAVDTTDNAFHKKDKNRSKNNNNTDIDTNTNTNTNSISSFEARENQHESEERKTTPKAIIAQEARTTKQQRSSFRRHSLDSRHNNNSIIVVARSKQTKNDTSNKNIIIETNNHNHNDDNSNMVRFSTINDNPWWKEQGPYVDRDGTDALSPQLIRTTADLGANKNDIDIIPSDVNRQEEIGVELENENERRDEKEEKICFMFENAKTFLEQTYKVKVSRQDKANNKVFISDHDIDTTKDSTEDYSAHNGCDHNSHHLNGSQVNDGNEEDDEEEDDGDDDDDGDDSTSNASSSSSSVFEFFDDMSILTNEDSTGDDDDGKDTTTTTTTTTNSNDFHVDLRTIEETPLLPEDIGKTEGKDLYFMVYSFTRGGDLCEDHRLAEDLIIAGEKNSRKALDKNHHVPLDFLIGFCYEDGFASKDELRMA
jgi:hypothetical protein